MKWVGLEREITLADAEREQDRLFDRPPRRPSPGTAAALRRAEPPPLSAEDVAMMKQKRRPGKIG